MLPLRPTPALARHIAEYLLLEIDQDNGTSWGPDNTACPYPAQVMDTGTAIVQAALDAGWRPSYQTLATLAAGEQDTIYRSLAKIPGLYQGIACGTRDGLLHQWLDWCFDMPWENGTGDPLLLRKASCHPATTFTPQSPKPN